MEPVTLRVDVHRIFEHRVSEANPEGELEVMHQCSNDADERLDTLRHHFNERIRVAGPRWIVELLMLGVELTRPGTGGKDPLTPKEMERRYNDKERAWRDTFSRLRLHLGVGGVS